MLRNSRYAVINLSPLCLMDEDGETRLQLSTDPEGPRILLADEKGETCADLNVTEDGPALELVVDAADGKQFEATLRVTGNGPLLELDDASGKKPWQSTQDYQGDAELDPEGTDTPKNPLDSGVRRYVMPDGLVVYPRMKRQPDGALAPSEDSIVRSLKPMKPREGDSMPASQDETAQDEYPSEDTREVL